MHNNNTVTQHNEFELSWLISSNITTREGIFGFKFECLFLKKSIVRSNDCFVAFSFLFFSYKGNYCSKYPLKKFHEKRLGLFACPNLTIVAARLQNKIYPDYTLLSNYLLMPLLSSAFSVIFVQRRRLVIILNDQTMYQELPHVAGWNCSSNYLCWIA